MIIPLQKLYVPQVSINAHTGGRKRTSYELDWHWQLDSSTSSSSGSAPTARLRHPVSAASASCREFLKRGLRRYQKADPKIDQPGAERIGFEGTGVRGERENRSGKLTDLIRFY
jgi:hypothetical protein